MHVEEEAAAISRIKCFDHSFTCRHSLLIKLKMTFTVN